MNMRIEMLGNKEKEWNLHLLLQQNFDFVIPLWNFRALNCIYSQQHVTLYTYSSILALMPLEYINILNTYTQKYLLQSKHL
jgi:hypothetical protein